MSDVEHQPRMAAMTPLAAILAERGISQYELRRRTLLSLQTISSAYRGHSSVSTKTWVKIARALDVKLAVFDPDTGRRSRA